MSLLGPQLARIDEGNNGPVSTVDDKVSLCVGYGVCNGWLITGELDVGSVLVGN